MNDGPRFWRKYRPFTKGREARIPRRMLLAGGCASKTDFTRFIIRSRATWQSITHYQDQGCGASCLGPNETKRNEPEGNLQNTDGGAVGGTKVCFACDGRWGLGLDLKLCFGGGWRTRGIRWALTVARLVAAGQQLGPRVWPC